MGEIALEKSARWIPGGVGAAEGWFIRRRIDADGVQCIIYDVDDDWQPRDVAKTFFRPDCTPLGIDWDAQPLGEVTDKVIADELGVTPSSVAKARLKRGIPGTRPAMKKLDVDWDQQPLGDRFDAEIARDLGVDATTVAAARKARGIARKYVDWDQQPLGKVSDAQLARELGVDSSTVSKARRARGIDPKTPKREIDWSQEPLGKISDTDIARGLGVSQSLVTRVRRRMGIPAFKNGRYRGERNVRKEKG